MGRGTLSASIWTRLCIDQDSTTFTGNFLDHRAARSSLGAPQAQCGCLVDSPLSRFQWEHEPEHGADSVWFLATEIPSVCSGVAACDGQPETRTAGVVGSTMIKSHQPMEDPFSLCWRNSGSGVPEFGDRMLIVLRTTTCTLP